MIDTNAIFIEINQARRQLGSEAVILVHHYQRDDVIRFADFRGDSLQLSRVAAGQNEARYIIFCGVNFMAETAAMLCAPEQIVVQPAGDAPCSMAQMTTVEDAQEAWDMLTQVWGENAAVPITYQNSTAAVKAFCGQRGGAVCTSSNAERLFAWALQEREHILFFPDEWLGANSALALGVPGDKIAVWDPELAEDSLAQAQNATVVVWKGYCNVHTRFTVAHIDRVREQYPQAQVIVHPECPTDVVQAADAYGSTAKIIDYVEQAPAGSVIAVGTEINMVGRLAREHTGKTIIPLTRSLCGAMYRTHPHNLRDALAACAAGQPRHIVTVDEQTRRWATQALERMLVS